MSLWYPDAPHSCWSIPETPLLSGGIITFRFSGSISKDLGYEGKEKRVIFNRWQMAAETFRRLSYKNKRSETETGESHPDFGSDTTEIPDHAREEEKEASKLHNRKDSGMQSSLILRPKHNIS